MKSWETVTYEVIEGNIARISLNRPEVNNAMNTQVKLDLDEATSYADRDPDINVIIIAANGENFSRGHDVGAFAVEIGEQIQTVEGLVKTETELFMNRWLKIRNLNTPTIAQVQGFCIAGGLILAAMCDLIVASEDAHFQNPACLIGAVGAEMPAEAWAVGIRNAKALLFTGKAIDAKEAWRMGLVTQVEKNEELVDNTLRLARRIASSPPWGVQTAKRLLNKTQDMMGLAASYELGFWMHEISHRSDEHNKTLEDMNQQFGEQPDASKTPYVSGMIEYSELSPDASKRFADIWQEIADGLADLRKHLTGTANTSSDESAGH